MYRLVLACGNNALTTTNYCNLDRYPDGRITRSNVIVIADIYPIARFIYQKNREIRICFLILFYFLLYNIQYIYIFLNFYYMFFYQENEFSRKRINRVRIYFLRKANRVMHLRL